MNHPYIYILLVIVITAVVIMRTINTPTLPTFWKDIQKPNPIGIFTDAGQMVIGSVDCPPNWMKNVGGLYIWAVSPYEVLPDRNDTRGKIYLTLRKFFSNFARWSGETTASYIHCDHQGLVNVPWLGNIGHHLIVAIIDHIHPYT